MKLTIPWTPLLAVLTLSLGTLAEGAAIATSPHSPTSRLDHQENLILAQVLGNVCGRLERDTGLFPNASTAGQSLGTLRTDTPVRLLRRVGNGWVEVREAFTPFRTGYILERDIGNTGDCGFLPTAEPPRQEFSCYLVDVDRLAVYGSPRSNAVSRFSLVKNDRVEHITEGLHNGTYPDPDTGLTWLQIRSVVTPQNPTRTEGWVRLQEFTGGNRREVRRNMVLIGACN
ncbi:MAG: SH3 domain-containing protein [Spirulina sp. DLM2.Bin59]|nr:MAG: SH3 domain-containing protein [Spirulina sp. DLM2.Bin59]